MKRRPTLPPHARIPINRCNLPSVILGSLTFQHHPTPLQLDGVKELHAQLFTDLDQMETAHERVAAFGRHMRAHFLLGHPDEAGFEHKNSKHRRKADYLRMLRGWFFDPDGKEAAVLKGWAESRFGLLPRNHHGPLRDFGSENYQRYLAMRSQGLYNTNALEAQLDLLYTYCQYELARQHATCRYFRLYRGINHIEEHEVLERAGKRTYSLILNNLNSFTGVRERAEEFGDYILEANVPLAKVMYAPGILPGVLKGEDEYLVIGGVYRAEVGYL
uniref:NAD+---dinitrogen-reductase ADP-D-ribosyltransferase n=1 Tax=Candidatus Kentrum sp. FW TaxID=2126338 RepID=A0A450TI36_9GAMM|nr:MAG: NAD+---dinitrogen-reductase ADP-D-ribosyltransferase [Candidatus Kentron sp. FW]